MAESKRKVEELKRSDLIATLEQSRVDIGGDLLDLRDSLSVAGRCQRSFQRHPAVWLGGAAAVGFLLSRPPLRLGGGTAKRGPAISGVLGFVAKHGTKLAIPMLRGAFMSYLERLVSGNATDKEINQDSSTLD